MSVTIVNQLCGVYAELCDAAFTVKVSTSPHDNGAVMQKTVFAQPHSDAALEDQSLWTTSRSEHADGVVFPQPHTDAALEDPTLCAVSIPDPNRIYWVPRQPHSDRELEEGFGPDDVEADPPVVVLEQRV